WRRTTGRGGRWRRRRAGRPVPSRRTSERRNRAVSGRRAGDQLGADHFLELRDHFVLGAAFLIVPTDDRAVAPVPADGARRNVQALADGLPRAPVPRVVGAG